MTFRVPNISTANSASIIRPAARLPKRIVPVMSTIRMPSSEFSTSVRNFSSLSRSASSERFRSVISERKTRTAGRPFQVIRLALISIQST